MRLDVFELLNKRWVWSTHSQYHNKPLAGGLQQTTDSGTEQHTWCSLDNKQSTRMLPITLLPQTLFTISACRLSSVPVSRCIPYVSSHRPAGCKNLKFADLFFALTSFSCQWFFLYLQIMTWVLILRLGVKMTNLYDSGSTQMEFQVRRSSWSVSVFTPGCPLVHCIIFVFEFIKTGM